MVSDRSNDFLHMIRYLSWVMKIYGLRIVSEDELQRRPPTTCQSIVRAIVPSVILVYSLVFTVSITNTVTSQPMGEVNLCFYMVMIIISALAVVALAVLILKGRRIERMAAKIQTACMQLDHPVFTRKVRIAVIVYTISPFAVLLMGIVYSVYQMFTGFSTDERVASYIQQSSQNDFILNTPHNHTQGHSLQMDAPTILSVSLSFIWASSVLCCLMHSIGLVIISISAIYHYFVSFVSKHDGQPEAGDERWSVKVGGRFSEENIGRCMDGHRAGCRIMKEANGALKELCFILSAAEVLVIIFSFRGMNLRNPEDGLGMKIIISNLLAYSTFIARALLASRVNRQVLSSLKVMLKVEPNDCPSPKMAKWIKGYVKHVKLDPPSFTGWGLYRFTEGCILTVSGHILTYTLTLYGIGG